MTSSTTTARARPRGLLAVGLVIVLGGCSSDVDPACPDVTAVEDATAVADTGDVGDAADVEDAGDAATMDEADDRPTASVAACDLLSLEDVTAAGVPAVSGPTSNDENPDVDVCDFLDDSGVEVFQVSVFPPADNQGLFPDEEVLDGIGARAIYSASLQVVNVDLEDGTFVSFFLRDTSLDTRAVLVDLARTALG